MIANGTRVKIDPEGTSWAKEQREGRDYTGTVIGTDDGLYVVLLDEPITYCGNVFPDVAVQKTMPVEPQ